MIFVIFVQIVKQVPVDILSAGNAAALSSAKCAAYAG
jgi:hypothetical protein